MVAAISCGHTRDEPPKAPPTNLEMICTFSFGSFHAFIISCCAKGEDCVLLYTINLLSPSHTAIAACGSMGLCTCNCVRYSCSNLYSELSKALLSPRL